MDGDVKRGWERHETSAIRHTFQKNRKVTRLRRHPEKNLILSCQPPHIRKRSPRPMRNNCNNPSKPHRSAPSHLSHIFRSTDPNHTTPAFCNPALSAIPHRRYSLRCLHRRMRTNCNNATIPPSIEVGLQTTPTLYCFAPVAAFAVPFFALLRFLRLTCIASRPSRPSRFNHHLPSSQEPPQIEKDPRLTSLHLTAHVGDNLLACHTTAH